ncbi:hypothetical protein DUI87_17012 [Hirundo rustica rustica]|uniref:Adaptin ear-binding coat-associated protein 1 n=1 Tax=Hirundo rustica rustica TaxID=333673 RepID=A0A3M0K3C1_HIRRU|nr:hypothetical protein DUI87_17012 [Hirundo rustica rustica]
MAAAELEYESVLCVKPDVNVYRIPPRTSNRGYRASDWKLDHPDWTGRLRVTSKGKIAYIKLEDKVSGELFAQAPIDQYPGIAVETVADSSRYFVIRIQDGTGRSAFIGIGFTDRGDAFDFNVSLQDHFKWVKQETEISKESQEADTRPKLDLGFKEGQTIKLNIGNMTSKKGGTAKPPIANHVTPPPVQKSSNASNADVLLDLDAPAAASKAPVSATTDLWGDFSTASSGNVETLPGSKPVPHETVSAEARLVYPFCHSSDQPSALQQQFSEWKCDSEVPQGTDRGWTCCPTGWSRFQRSCYFLSPDKMNCADSEQNCTGMGSQLVVINSKEEQVFLSEEIKQTPKIENFYIGLFEEKVGQWQWVDKTPYSVTAAFWRKGEPSAGSDENCTVMHGFEKDLNNWNDVRSDYKHHRICEAAAVTV